VGVSLRWAAHLEIDFILALISTGLVIILRVRWPRAGQKRLRVRVDSGASYMGQCERDATV
jgi:hypothetical protein